MRNRDVRALGLRLPAELVDAVEVLAERNMRSLNAEIAWLLTQQIQTAAPDLAPIPKTKEAEEK